MMKYAAGFLASSHNHYNLIYPIIEVSVHNVLSCLPARGVQETKEAARRRRWVAGEEQKASSRMRGVWGHNGVISKRGRSQFPDKKQTQGSKERNQPRPERDLP